MADAVRQPRTKLAITAAWLAAITADIPHQNWYVYNHIMYARWLLEDATVSMKQQPVAAIRESACRDGAVADTDVDAAGLAAFAGVVEVMAVAVVLVFSVESERPMSTRSDPLKIVCLYTDVAPATDFTLKSAHGFNIECRYSFTPLSRQIRPSG